MKKIFIILFLISNLQLWTTTNAADIDDLEIEGISLGNSALDFFAKSEIDKTKGYVYPNKKYAMFAKNLTNSNYDSVLIEFVDKGKYKIDSVIGKIFYKNDDFDQCPIKEKEILFELKKQFKNNAKYTNHGITAHEADPSGNSKGSWHTFKLNDGSGWIYLECMDWTEEMDKWDNLRVTIYNKVFENFLLNEAYK